MNLNPNAEEIARKFGCTPDQARKQFVKNAAHIRAVIAKLATRETVDGYTQGDIPKLRNALANFEGNAKGN